MNNELSTHNVDESGEDLKASWKLWDMANGITAFSVVQSITLAVSSSTQAMNAALGTSLGFGILMAFTTGATLTHVAAVRWCDRQAKALLGSWPRLQGLWTGATQGRVAALIVFNVLLLLCGTAVYVKHRFPTAR